MSRLSWLFIFVFLVVIPPWRVALGSVDLGKPAPEFSATELSGRQFKLSAEKGKVVVLVYFATWCDSCKTEFPVLKALDQKLHSKGLVIQAVSINRSGDRKDVEHFVHPYGISTAMLNDVSKNGFGSPAILPTIYVVDRTGVVRTRLVPSDEHSFQKRLNQAIQSCF